MVKKISLLDDNFWNLLETFNQAIRNFEYDYIYIDALFLGIWTLFLIKYKKWTAIKVGILTGFVVYFIDAIMWWNLPAGEPYPSGTYIREYWIGGIKIPNNLQGYFWLKFGADFMMTFSYSMFAFAWLYIMFDNIKNQVNKKEILLFTSLYFASWMLIPFISRLLPIDDRMIYTHRLMNSQMPIWIANAIIGYSILALIYGTDYFKSKNPKIIGYVFIIGCIESFFMEFPLFIWGIRPSNLLFLLFETVILFHQGAPYLYIAYDKVFPKLGEILKNWFQKKQEKEIVVDIK